MPNVVGSAELADNEYIHDVVLNLVWNWIDAEERLNTEEELKPIDQYVSNIATFNLEAISDKRGYDRLRTLMFHNSKKLDTLNHLDCLMIRLRRLNAAIHIRFGGTKGLDRLKKQAILSYTTALRVDKRIVTELDNELDNLLWLLPFIQSAWMRSHPVGT